MAAPVEPKTTPTRSSAPTLIMFIRHGEKPSDHGAPHGINHHGEQDPHSLSVRGWMRAGALAGVLSHGALAPQTDLRVPERVIATKPSPEAKSHREVDTATPIARKLDLVVESDLGHGQEVALAQRVLTDPRPALVVWHHGTLTHLVRAFPLANPSDVPDQWPADRFDVVWVLSRVTTEDHFTFRQVNQGLLDGDAPQGSP